MDTLDTVHLPIGPTALSASGLLGPDSEIIANFTWPGLGRPHFPPPAPSDPPTVLPSAVRVPGPETDPTAVRRALEGRIALWDNGDPSRIVPALLADPLADGDGWVIPLLASVEERRLYDVAIRGAHNWVTVAPHAIYYRSVWDTFGIAHISDLHVARRIDGFAAALARAGHEQANERLLNMNDQFRHVVKYANRLHDEGHLDLIVATGDLIDYQYERDDNRRGLGNVGFLRDLLLGRSTSNSCPAVEELRVPILLTPGNHDYRKNHYHLVFDVNEVRTDITRVRNFSNLGITEKEAAALGNELYFPGRSQVPNLGAGRAMAMIEVDHEMRAHREALCDIGPHVVELGPHRIVLIDSAHDVGIPSGTAGGAWELLKQWWGNGDEDTTTLIGGSPNCEGVSDEAYAVAVAALESAPAEGVVIAALHAPLVNLAGGQMPWFLRETTRPSQAAQAAWWVARHSGGDPDVRRTHPRWFGREGDPEPGFLCRGSSGDLLDEGVSRGRTEDLISAFAGIGTSRRADLVLAGHTHHHNEISIRAEEGEPVFHLDHYTGNPRAAYPNDTVIADEIGKRPDGRLDLPTHEVYVEIDDLAVASASPWPMPGPARHRQVVFVPPYADPLDQATDPRAWWDKHKPLQLQTGAVGLWENQEVSFSGFRLIRLRDNVIERIDFVSRIRLDESGWSASLAEVTAPLPPRSHRLVPRSDRVAHPPAAGTPTTLVAQGGVSTSIVHPTADGSLVELWQTTSGEGGGVLVGPPQTHAVGRPCGYLDSGGSQVVVFRTADDEIESTYWTGEGAAGHDRLSRSCRGPRAVGDPSGYLNGAMTHVVYRSEGGHLELLWWTDDAVTHTRISGYCDEPTAAGDPFGYVGAGGQNVVLYRGVDGHVHSLYWSDGPTGHDNLSGVSGGPEAAGEPVGIHLPHLNAHNVLYRGVDGSLRLIWWVGAEPAQSVDLCAAAGAPAAVSDGDLWFCPSDGTLHVAYVGKGGSLHEIAWSPGGPQTWTDLTRVALAPPARRDRPSGFCVPGAATRRVVYAAADGRVHEIRWGEGGAEPGGRP